MCVFQARDVRTNEVVAIKKMSYSGKQSNEVGFLHITQFSGSIYSPHNHTRPDQYLHLDEKSRSLCRQWGPTSAWGI